MQRTESGTLGVGPVKHVEAVNLNERMNSTFYGKINQMYFLLEVFGFHASKTSY